MHDPNAPPSYEQTGQPQYGNNQPPGYQPNQVVTGQVVQQPVYNQQPVYAQQQQQPMYNQQQPVYNQQQQPVYAQQQQPVLLNQGPVLTPQQAPIPLDVQQGDWQDGLCDCFANITPSCLMSTCCPCVMLGQIAQRIETTKCTNVVGIYFTCLILENIISAATGGVFIPFSRIYMIYAVTKLRSDFRVKFQIPGGSCEDLACSVCCQCCALAQMARHLYNYPSSCDDCAWENDGVTRSRPRPGGEHYVVGAPPGAVSTSTVTVTSNVAPNQQNDKY